MIIAFIIAFVMMITFIIMIIMIMTITGRSLTQWT